MCYFRKKYVSFLSCFWANIYFPCGRNFSFYSSYFFDIFIGLLSLHSEVYALIKLRVSISLWFFKELFELIGYSVMFIKTYQSDLHHQLWRPHIYQGSCFHISNGSRSSIQADTRAVLPSKFNHGSPHKLTEFVSYGMKS